MLYKITTVSVFYKKNTNTRILQKLGFAFKEIDRLDTGYEIYRYHYELVENEIIKEMTSDEVIKLSNIFRITLHKDKIKIYDSYIE